MFFNYRLFIKALGIALLRQPFHWKRWAYVLFFSGVYLGSVVLVAAGRALDHLLFPGFRRQAVESPVFIIAPPRSGTSFLQKLLSLDREKFLYWKMYQTVFPAVCFQKLFNGVAGVDRLLGHRLSRMLAWAEKHWFGGWDDKHKMRMGEPEEDHALFLYAFTAEAVFMLFPYVESLWEAGFPDAMPTEKRRKLMAYYRSCLQRHLYANGGNKTLLVKATQSSGAVRSLIEEFPDAKFITIVRHPHKSVASHVSLFVPIWQTHSPDIAKDGPEAKAYAQLAVEWYKHLFHFSSHVEPANYHCIAYPNLKADPVQTVRQIYRQFGWQMSDAYVSRLKEHTKNQHLFQSQHEYSLEEFGLSPQWLDRELGEVLAAYGLAADGV